MPVRDLTAEDLDWVLAINRTHEALLSRLDRAGLAGLVARATLARAVGRSAFLIAFDQAADYQSPNFLWFRARYPRFLYVDRVAVDAAAAGAGQGSQLYADLFDRARAIGHRLICAEVNSEPPNEASLAFHARHGFEPVGEEALEGQAKSVRYFVRESEGGG